MVRNLKKTSLVMLVLAFAEFFYSTPLAAAIPLANNEKAGVDLFGTLQMLGLAQHVKDQVKKDNRIYLFMQQARLGFAGHLEDYRFYSELALGGENSTAEKANPGENIRPAFTLLEMRVDVPTWQGGLLRLGQFKSPYGAEFLTPDHQRYFSESSIANLGANWGREVGLALASKRGVFSWALGTFTGGGSNTSVLPIHALPENLGVPVLMGRLGIDTTASDVFTHQQAGLFDIPHHEGALYLHAAFTRDTTIGHSTLINIKAEQADLVYQQNLLLNPAWNPYLTTLDRATLYSYGLNGIIRKMIGGGVASSEFEASSTVFKNIYGTLKLHTARLQAAWAKKPWEAALRVAGVFPDRDMGPNAKPGLIGATPFYEATPAVSYYLKDWSKLVFEFQGLIKVPVAHEPKNGSYVLSDMPSQTTYTAGAAVLPNIITREFVPEYKLMWQITI
jgi:hypothetical protein